MTGCKLRAPGGSLLKEALGQAAQESDGFTIPGGVQKTCRRGTPGHGLAGMVVMGWRLELMILEVFSNLSDSVIARDNIAWIFMER